MSTKSSKGYIGIGMEGPIANWYAESARKDTRDQKKTARLIADRLSAGSAILEVAPGPGYLAIELAGLGEYKITGLDISQTFVEMARKKAKERGVQVDFQHGNASQMPFADNQFDQIVCVAAFKNFAEPIGALNEMYRVLKPGGRAAIFDLRGDASEAEINEHVNSMGLGKLNTFMIKWTFKFMLLKRAYTPASFEEMVAQSKFKDCEIHQDPIGMAVWLNR